MPSVKLEKKILTYQQGLGMAGGEDFWTCAIHQAEKNIPSAPARAKKWFGGRCGTHAIHQTGKKILAF